VHKKINISINSLSPGGVYNNQNKKFYYNYKKFCKSKGMVSATELISTTEFLLAKGSKSITGQDIKIDDGFSI
jgi:enoyl-[acyl-carrier-protein] reductase (NADH)